MEDSPTTARGDHFEENNMEDSPTSAWGEDQQENNSDNIEDSPTPARGGNQQEKMDYELVLIENAFEYLTKKTYPPQCTKNDKRVIRRKADKLEERDGEIFYKKRGGSTVSVTAK